MHNNSSSHVVRLRARKNTAGATTHAHVDRVVLSVARPRERSTQLQKNNSIITGSSAQNKSWGSGMMLAHGMLGKVTAILLIPMLFVYPLLPAYAADEEVASPPPVAEVAPTPLPSPTTEAVASEPTTESVTDGESTTSSDTPAPTDEASTVVTGETPDTSSGSESGTGDGASGTESGEVLGDTTVLGADGTALIGSTDVATTSDNSLSGTSTEPVVVSNGIVGDGASTTSETLQDESSGTNTASMDTSSLNSSLELSNTTTSTIVDESAPSDEEPDSGAPPTLTPEEIAAKIIAQREEVMRANIRKEVESEFSKGCLTIDNIGYYCLKDPGVSSGALTPSSAISNVTARPNSSGTYKQIFITKDGGEVQVTHSLWDNAFPSTDVSGRSLVWQGEVSGRWQIFFADAATTGPLAILQLTNSSESNFNPRVDGGDVVWQSWSDGNWEIFLAERVLVPPTSGDALSPSNKSLGVSGAWKVTRLTTNTTHDMFPAIAGGLVTWQSFQDNAWSVYAYSMKSGATTKLSQGGAKSENPRFAITWDERTSEGKARMMGYDIATGKMIDLTNEARQVNDNNAPYHPTDAPISQPNQAVLPIATSSTSTTMKVDGDGGDGANPIGT